MSDETSRTNPIKPIQTESPVERTVRFEQQETRVLLISLVFGLVVAAALVGIVAWATSPHSRPAAPASPTQAISNSLP